MNRDETVALFLQGREAWNAWAEEMLAQRKALEADGRWAAELQPWGALEPKNDETRAWIETASADFFRCHFLVQGVEATKLAAGEDNEREEEASEPPVKSIAIDGERIDFEDFVFPSRIDFQNAIFSAGANFWSTAFFGSADFKGAAFSGDAVFPDAAFSGQADFRDAAFSGDADFESAAFSGNANFWGAAFSGDAAFESGTFSNYADFRSATFTSKAGFGSVTFSGGVDFPMARFTGIAQFENTTFNGYADFRRTVFASDAGFQSATFSEHANFWSAAFASEAYFQKATFKGNALFPGQTFTNDIFFNGVKFEPDSNADFGLATFERVAQFDDAIFAGEADFSAVRGKRTFSMARARFKGLPDFIQAHFEEAPRLDNVVVEGRLFEVREDKPKEGEKLPRCRRLHRGLASGSGLYRRAVYHYRRVTSGIAQGSGLRDMPSRWRALKRLAIQGHDTDRELDFHAREVRSQRFTGDWPVPWPVWRGNSWASFFRFWFGIFYGVFSDFGRSLGQPIILWLLAVIVGAVVYVSQSPAMIEARHKQEAKGASMVSAATSRAWHAWLSKTVPCYSGQETPPKDKNGDTPVYVGALSKSLQDGTDLANEAWHLAFRNAFIVLDGSAEAAHRTYGCLYGVELYGGSNPLAVVPSAVSTVSAVQKLFSALMIFLFGLALRNMLKMK